VLFSDIVGSTPLLAAGQDRYPDLLFRHRELLGMAAVRHGGTIVPREGDGCLGLFPSATAAISAGVDGQHALAAEPWPEGLTVRVRMVVHEGDVVEADGEPVGLAVHHAARMLVRAGAAQVLVSETAAASASPLPQGIRLVDGGTHRLRDLPRPIRLLQVAADGLVVLDPSGAAQETEALVGRDQEVAEASAALESHRMVTITGPGGSGKTRLAQAVAEEWRARGDFDAVCWVELAGLSDASLVPTTLLAELGIDPGGDEALPALVRSLAVRRLLLVLDNCEHLVDGLLPLIEATGRGCPEVKILATSRASLGSRWETERQLAPLAVPQVSDSGQDDPSKIAGSPSVELFTARAAAVCPGFRLTRRNARQIAEVCRRLGGLPLAIELAAARLRVLSLDQLLVRLDDLDVLKDGRSRDSRQRTMRATIDWSHRLLDVDEQAAFRRISVFAGGFVLEAAEAVLRPFGLGAAATTDLVERLLANGLMLADLESQEPRFHLLEPVRQYAAERLVGEGDADRAQRAHAAWVVNLAEAAEREFFGAQAVWATRLRQEQPNIRAALLGALARGDGVTALRIAAALAYPWFTMGQPDGRVLLDRALEAAGSVDDRFRARALLGAGMLAQDATDFDAALPLLEEALALFQAGGGRRGQAWTLIWLARDQNRFTDAARREMLERALALFREADHPPGIAWSLSYLASFQIQAGDLEGGRRRAEEALAVASVAGATQPVAEALRVLGWVAFREGDIAEARRLWEEAVEIHRAGHDPWQEAVVAGQAGQAAALMRDVGAALEHFARSVSLAADINSHDHFAVLLQHLVPVLWELERRDEAAQLLGSYDAVRSGYYDDRMRHLAARIKASDLEGTRVCGTLLPLVDAIGLANRVVAEELAARSH
jgi:predicted ATPase